MSKVALLLVSGALVNNVVLSRFLGLCSFVGVSKKKDTAAGMGGAVIFTIFLATILSSLVYMLVLRPLKIDYLQTIVFILLIALYLILRYREKNRSKYEYGQYPEKGEGQEEK